MLRLRVKTLGSEIGKVFWILLCMVAFTGAFLQLGISQVTNADSREEIPWSLLINGTLLETDVDKVSAALSPYDAKTLYTCYGEFKRITSNALTVNYRLQSVDSPMPVLSYQILSRGSSEELPFPWFSERTLVAGSLNADTPVVIDAKTAKDFKLTVGSPLAVEIDVALLSGETETIVENLLITAIVRPTVRFKGICAAFPHVEDVLYREWGVRGNDLFIYGVDSDETTLIVTKLNELLITEENDINRAVLPSYDAANRGMPMLDISPDESRYEMLIMATAALVILLISLFDARNIMVRITSGLKHSKPSKRDFVLSIIIEDLLVFIPAVIVSFAISCFVLASVNEYNPWILTHILAIPVLAGSLVVVLAILTQVLVSLRLRLP
jgi:hypothetical protein